MKYFAAKVAFFIFILANVTGFNEGGDIGRQGATKTIHMDNGDTFDCVNINSQPALRHPLLQNHTIKMAPSSFPTGTKENSPAVRNTSEINVSAIACPVGTIPIWRSHKDIDLSRFSSMRTLRGGGIDKKMDPVAFSDTKLYEAMYGTEETNRGTKAVISVYEPLVIGGDEYSYSAGIASLYSEQTNTFDYISAGWAVYPSISDDNYARLFIFWRNDPEEIDCVNLFCPGFVQVSHDIALGIRLQPASAYGGRQYDITVQLFKDRETEDWWLTFGRQNKLIGYWPKELFKHLTKDEIIVGWGGEVRAPLNELSFQMGSGHFPQEGFGKAAYVVEAEIVNTNDELITPEIDKLGQSTRQPDCYNVGEVELRKSKRGFGFFFGGLGGCQG